MSTAYEEFLSRQISIGKGYDELPPRIQSVVSPQDWKIRVKDYCIQKGLAWADCLASSVCSEQEYYDDLVRACKGWVRMYPYHLAEYVCRVQRTTPYRYYCDVLTNMLKDEKSYDRIPNFTAADIVRVLGIGRNEYIAMLNQCKGRRLMWRMNPKGLARELLPSAPCRPLVQPWWLVEVVNIAETEYRELGPEEVANLKTANLPDAMRVQDLEQEVLMSLYRRGLVYFDIPISPDDRFAIPPLEGFVSNRTPTGGDAADPLEALLYSVFVASSESLKVSDLAQILNVSISQVQTALALAVRLGFATRLREDGLGAKRAPTLGLPLIDLEDDSSTGSSQHPMGAGAAAAASAGAALLGGLLMGSGGSGGGVAEAGGGGGAGAGAGSEGGRAVALLLDAEATSYLMMGALSPGLKRHSVTLFEGGRVAGEAVMNELMEELWQSYEQGQGFEGDMLKLTHFVGALATSLEALREGSAGRPIELLRKESLAGLPPAAACKVLYHAYCAVVPAAPLPGPPLPLLPDQPGPAYYGPVGEAAGPWLQLALYVEGRCGPTSVVLLRGQRLHRLPRELSRCSHALIWPWQPPSFGGSGGGAPLPLSGRANGGAGAESVWATAAAAAGAEGSSMVLVEAAFMLYMINEALLHTAVMVQPCDGVALAAAQGAAAGAREEKQAAAARASSDGGGGAAEHGLAGRGGDLIVLEEGAGGGWEGGQGHAGRREEGTAGQQGQAEGKPQEQLPGGVLLVDVPLPLPEPASPSPSGPSVGGPARTPKQDMHVSGGGATPGGGAHGGWEAMQGVERHSSARGRAVTVPLPPGVREAVSVLGLGSSVGVLRMMLWPDQHQHQQGGPVAAASPAAAAPAGRASGRPSLEQQGQGQERQRQGLSWVPLSVSLGLPLHCLPLCRLVCARALAAGFLTADGRAAQARGQAALRLALQQLVSEHASPHAGAAAGAGLSAAPSSAASLLNPLSPMAAAQAQQQAPQAQPWQQQPQQPQQQQQQRAGGGGKVGPVLEPQCNLYFDGTRLTRLSLGYCLQGGATGVLGW